jgi:high-affinity Fe2+/Pb2+ permease
MKRNRYTFLEWVFDDLGLAKFLLFFYLFLLLLATGILSLVWWYTKR